MLGPEGVERNQNHTRYSLLGRRQDHRVGHKDRSRWHRLDHGPAGYRQTDQVVAGSKRSLSAVERIARLSSKPDRQLSSLQRLLGLSKLLHYVRPDQADKAKWKHSMEFISICHEALGDTFNSLFTGKTEAEIYDLTIPEVWAEVEYGRRWSDT